MIILLVLLQLYTGYRFEFHDTCALEFLLYYLPLCVQTCTGCGQYPESQEVSQLLSYCQ